MLTDASGLPPLAFIVRLALRPAYTAAAGTLTGHTASGAFTCRRRRHPALEARALLRSSGGSRLAVAVESSAAAKNMMNVPGGDASRCASRRGPCRRRQETAPPGDRRLGDPDVPDSPESSAAAWMT